MSAVSLPNVLTYLRILAVPAVVLCLFLIPGDTGRWWALAVYVGACITDWLDGYLARVWRQQSCWAACSTRSPTSCWSAPRC